MFKNIEQSQKTEERLPAALWLYGPWLFFIGLLGLYHFEPKIYNVAIDGEGAFQELFHTGIIFLAFFVSLPLLRMTIAQKDYWLTGWVGIAALASLYIGLEEISYGQHFFGWEASEFWKSVNDQNETNLHNTSSWLDQKPRLLLEVGVIIGGIIMPLMMKFMQNPEKILPQKFAIIYPSFALFHIAVLAEIAHIIEKLIPYKIMLMGRASEVQETYYFYFILIYLVVLYKRVKNQ